MTAPLKRILLVEDSNSEIILFLETLKLFNCQAHIDVLNYGKEVVPFLKAKTSSPPNLIILDLGLPDINGKEILKSIKQHPNLSGIPVIVRTGFNAEAEKEDCYQLGANWYVEKKCDISSMEEQIRDIIQVLYK